VPARPLAARDAASFCYDAIVIGLGAMGSAALYQLAKAGASVLGIDRYSPPHTLGSTHGDTRITRLAIGEGAEYVPLVKRSHEIWRELEEESGLDLFQQCGGLIMAVQGAPGIHESATFLGQTVASAEQYGIGHERLSADQIRMRYPQFDLAGSESGYYEPEAGFLRPERCVQAQLRLARQRGATIRLGEEVLSYREQGDRVTVTTRTGPVLARRVVVAAGPWLPRLVPDLAGSLKVYRQVMYWFDLSDKTQYDTYREMPIFIWEFGTGQHHLMYGFPAIDGPHGGAKVATEQYSEETTTETVARVAAGDEIDAMYERYVKDRLPGLSSRCLRSATCLYTVAPASHFLIDFHPMEPNVIIASACSGHGFKHSAAIGEVLAQLVVTGRSDIDISPFALGGSAGREQALLAGDERGGSDGGDHRDGRHRDEGDVLDHDEVHE
jgi:sarcosine oxidase